MSKIVERGRQRRLTADYRKRHRKSEALGSAIKIDLVKGIETFKRNLDPMQLLKAIKTGKMSKVLEAVPWKRLDKNLSPAMEGLSKAGRIASSAAYSDLPPKAKLAQDLRNPELKGYIENRTGELIKTIKEGGIEAIRQSTARSFSQALTPAEVAAEIRGSIGLNARQAVALANYRTKLEQEGTLSKRAIKAAADGYQERLLDQRAIMIARTETRFAQNAGEQAVWSAAKEEGLIPAKAKKVWVVDGNPCPKICQPMNMVAVGIDEQWTLPDGRRVSVVNEAHPNCLCASVVSFDGS